MFAEATRYYSVVACSLWFVVTVSHWSRNADSGLAQVRWGIRYLDLPELRFAAMFIFFLPLVYSVFALFMILASDAGWITKGIFTLLAGAAITMQFVPGIGAMVHFLVPLAMQFVVIIGYHVIQASE